MKIRIKGILFDMDGVLVSSIGSVERSWTKWAESQGIDPVHAIETAHGRRSIESIRFLRPEADAEAENLKIENWEIEDTAGVEQLAGVAALIDKLPRERWVIVTSATRRLAEVRLGVAGITPPDKWITADDVVNGKPDPEPYQKGAAMLGFSPEDCLVIEDAASGARAGRAARCKVLATTFSHSIEALTAADWVVESLEAVKVTVLGDEAIELDFEPLTRP